MNFSTAEENYIKAIWRLQQSDANVTTNELAAELQTKPASVTDMLKRLKEKNLPSTLFANTGSGNSF